MLLYTQYKQLTYWHKVLLSSPTGATPTSLGIACIACIKYIRPRDLSQTDEGEVCRAMDEGFSFYILQLLLLLQGWLRFK